MNYFMSDLLICSVNLLMVLISDIYSIVALTLNLKRKRKIIKFSELNPKYRLLENIALQQSNKAPFRIMFDKKLNLYNLGNNFMIERKNKINICSTEDKLLSLKVYWNCILDYEKLFILDNNVYKMVFPGCFANELKRAGWIN
ncbi:hypothetical protein [Mycoplasmopsis felifaucium]|uniref:Uncharacterized protein n=1 Tax=Mycoplasmopsis felifaucium TaxID=35768 RepID=A0ABZ2RY43_9BACT